MLAPFVGVLYKFLYKSLWGETYPLHNPRCGNPLSDPMRRVTPCSLMLLGFVRPKEALLGGVPESCLKLTCTPVGPQEICVCVTCQIGECQFSTTGLSPPFSSPCQEGTKSRTANSLYNQTSVWRMGPPFPQVRQMRWLVLLEVPLGLKGECLFFPPGGGEVWAFPKHGIDSPHCEGPKWERAKQKVYPFYDFASEVIQPHFCHILLVRRASLMAHIQGKEN